MVRFAFPQSRGSGLLGETQDHRLPARRITKRHARACLCFSGDKDNPAYAVCCRVLNLLSQVGFLPGNSALAQAYRVVIVSWDPVDECWLRTVGAASRAQQGTLLIPQTRRHE